MFLNIQSWLSWCYGLNSSVLPFCDVVLVTHIEYSNKCSLQQPHQHVAPVVLVIRDSGVTHIHREGHQEELDGGAKKSGPLSHEPRLHVKLEWGLERKKSSGESEEWWIVWGEEEEGREEGAQHIFALTLTVIWPHEVIKCLFCSLYICLNAQPSHLVSWKMLSYSRHL